MFLLEKDYLSIWEDARRWPGFDPEATAPWLRKPSADTPQQKANINNRPRDEETDRLLYQAVALATFMGFRA